MGVAELPQRVYGMPKPTQGPINQKEIAIFYEVISNQGFCWGIAEDRSSSSVKQ